SAIARNARRVAPRLENRNISSQSVGSRTLDDRSNGELPRKGAAGKALGRDDRDQRHALDWLGILQDFARTSRYPVLVSPGDVSFRLRQACAPRRHPCTV